MTFTYVTSNDIGKVRYYLDDTIEARAKFPLDSDIQFALDTAGSVGGAVILSLQVLLLRLAEPDYTADWLEELNHDKAAKTLQAALTKWRQHFGISELTVSATHVYRADSQQTSEPDYSDGV